MEHCLDDDLCALEEVAARLRFPLEEGVVLRDFLVGQRTAEGALPEAAQELRAAGSVARGRGRAGNQVVAVSAAEGVAGEFFGGGSVGFGEQRRHALSFGLVLEAVDVVLGRKVVRGARLVAEQVADRVVVLAVREPPHHAVNGAGFVRQRRGQRGAAFLDGELGEPADP